MADDLDQKIFFSNQLDHQLPECSEHNAGAWKKLKLTIDGDVWVSKDGFRLQFCPVCLIDLMEQRFDAEITDITEASHRLLRSVIGDDSESPMSEFMVNLGPGEVTADGIYLEGTPVVDRIPAWIVGDGLEFVDADREAAIDEAYRDAFRERFGYTPETVAAPDPAPESEA